MVSTQQYLCPDYLNPLPSTLDSNKSPLALLAQTCNNIGLPDSQSNKVKSTNSESNSTTKSDKNNKDDASKVYKTSTQADSTSGDSIELTKSKELSSEKKSSNDSRHRSSAINDESTKNDVTIISSVAGSSHEPSTPSSSSSDPKISSQSAASPTSTSSAKCGTCVTPGYPPHLFTHYFPPTSAAGYPFVHGVPSLPLSCYPGYPSGSLPMFPRLCTDPFCKSCPPNPTAINLNPASMSGPSMRPCPLGCAQCTTHPTDLSLWLNSYSLLNAGFHGFGSPAVPSLAATSPNSAALMAAATAVNPFVGHYPQNVSGQNGPPTCLWNSGEGYCLKKFSNAEELLQHLRTHAHESTNKTAKNPLLLGQFPSMSGRLSPRSMTYLNSLNSLRYHPYNKLSSPTPNGGVSSSSSLPLVPFPTLNSAAYGLQSGLFAGQRLPGSLPHP